MLRAVIILLAFHLFSIYCFAAEKNAKGLLPEVRLTNNNEDENEKRAFKSEVMITRSENKAIESLQQIIKKKKGSREEADLWYRLAELYMRRSKSGRFFDLHQDTPLLKLSPFPVANEKGAEAVKRAAKIYTKIEVEFPNFKEMDAVLFNNAFAHQQIGQFKTAEQLFSKLLAKFPKSPLIPDGTLAAGELLYDQGRFKEALEHFLRVEKFPESRVYSYGMYKAAWAYYNLRESDKGIEKLVQVVKTNPALKDGEVPNNRHNLRREAMRDLTIFVGDTYPANKLFSFFEDIANEDELGEAMMNMAKLYMSHSREKEMDTFLEEYIDKRSSGPDVVRAHLMLVEGNETLKRRPKVINHLTYASDLCRTNSSWKSLQNADDIKGSCEEGFRRVSLDMAKKWWEIWLKNKQNKEFSDLTQQLFKLILDNEDPTKPDLKTRFAYAELLFQLEKYDEASVQYKIVSDKSTEPTMNHDATYAALYSKEKSIEKKKEPLKEAERKELAKNYLAKHPTGKYATLVKFKVGHIAYEEANYEEAEKWLKPLTLVKGNDDIKRKSEDLVLDMLNIKKDYAGIKAFSKQVSTSTGDDSRKKNMNKIMEEAHFTEIQEFSKTGNKDQASEKLLAFAKEHEDSPLAQDALWQALSMMYAEGKVFDAAELSLKFVKKYPSDKRNLDVLKEAAKAYADVGQIGKAAETLEKIADLDKKGRANHLELAADIYLLEKKTKEARQAYQQMLVDADRKTTERIYTKLLDSYKNEPKSAELEKLQNQISAKGIEPFSTQIMIDRAKALLAAGKTTQAFDLSMKANGRDVAAEIRAEARLIQAQILEQELVKQSVKAREDKFAMVLGMKTEKLDKAHTAYFTTLKMSKDPYQQLEAMRGIDRCYANFIESLTTMPLPASLSPADQEALRGEVAKLTAPIQEKKNENEAKLKVLAASKGQAATETRSYASIPVNQTVPPMAQYPTPEKMVAYLPKSMDMTIGRVSQLDTKGAKTCDRSALTSGALTKSSPTEIVGNCYSSRQWDMVEKMGLELAKGKDTRALGLFYVSLGAEARGFADKALWMIEASLKIQPEAAPYVYQKARLVYKADGIKDAMPFFEKVLDMQMSSTEMQTFAGVKAFSEGDYTSATTKFSALNKEQLYNYNVGTLMSEAYAQKGEVDKALGVLKDLLNLKKENADLLLQQAHVFETYKGSPTLALDSYEKAFKASSQMDMRDWLGKKIQYLKTQNKVGQHVISGDL
ncbi:adventurous gliding motility protein U [Bdellovibrio bacteriovorus]|uniref:Adventurous gliding motility protein U n=1 Tax=Bdellovibrio bacteriovorus TaxID=959 RepID=A0A150WLX9_BDEBC|nr:tetratricopeptide repeat protein [Bdellovibrio bacteriovorus]KYG64980.1 adventurous gliding motility protein U [Bdellovibrio bacteriovorus]